MSSNQEIKEPNSSEIENPNSNKNISEMPESKLPFWQEKIKAFLSSWKFKLSVVLTSIIAIILVIFFWQHTIAVTSMKLWASHAQAKPIDCMMKDTNGDEYISCTAILDEQIVPLECGVSLFNLGCRVNYGTASPSFKGLKINK